MNPIHWLRNEEKSGFPNLAKAGVQLPEDKEADPCKAQIRLKFNDKHPSSGFGSKVNNFFDLMGMAAYGNYTGALGQSVFTETWQTYFADVSTGVCEDPNWNGAFSTEMNGEGLARSFWTALAKKDPEFVVKAKRALYQKHYKLSSKSIQKVASLLKEFDLPKQYYGVHIRGGDKVRETHQKIEAETFASVIKATKESKFATSMMEQMSELSDAAGASEQMKLKLNIAKAAHEILSRADENIRTVYLATTSKNAETGLRESLGEEYDVKVLSTDDGDWQRNPKSLFFEESPKMYNLLADIEALRRSTHFIGTGSSNMGRLVFFLRSEQSTATSMDDDFLKGDQAFNGGKHFDDDASAEAFVEANVDAAISLVKSQEAITMDD